MTRWRFWRKPEVTIDLTELAPAIEDASEDGLAMAKQAALMSLKNRILVETITKPDAFEPDSFVPVAQEIVHKLADEHRESARLLTDEIRRAQRLPGEAMSKDDYRRGDVPNLTIRKESLLNVAKSLTEKEESSQAMRDLVSQAHSMAWAEISDEMQRSLDRAEAREFGDENYEEDRASRLRAFINLDLAQLIEENTPEY